MVEEIPEHWSEKTLSLSFFLLEMPDYLPKCSILISKHFLLPKISSET